MSIAEVKNKYKSLDESIILKYILKYICVIYGSRSKINSILYNTSFDEPKNVSYEDALNYVLGLVSILQDNLNSSDSSVDNTNDIKENINNINIDLKSLTDIVTNINEKTIVINNGIND